MSAPNLQRGRCLGVAALAMLLGGCGIGADYRDPCAGHYDTTTIAPVLPAGDGTFYVGEARAREPAPAINVSYLYRLDAAGQTVWLRPMPPRPYPTEQTVENGALVTLSSDRMFTQPLDGSDAVETMLVAGCDALVHFSDGVVLGQSGYFHQPCTFTIGSAAAPLLIGDDAQSTWFVSGRAPDGGWVSWHADELWRFDATGKTLWHVAAVGNGGLPSQLQHSSRGWLLGMSGSTETASTILRIADDGSTVTPLYTAVAHSDGKTSYYEALGIFFELADHIAVTSSSFEPKPQTLTVVDEDGAVQLQTALDGRVASAFAVGDALLLGGTGILVRVDGAQVSWQRHLDGQWTVTNVLADGSYFIIDAPPSGSCVTGARLGLFDPSGAAQWWTPQLDLH